MAFFVLFLIVLCLGVAAPAHAGWVWSPQTGWIGPTGAVKDSSEEQLAHAMKLFEQQAYRRARLEFQKLLKAYKDSRAASEAQYYIGRCREEEADYYEAFVAYRTTIETYPSTSRFEEILERMYQIGTYFLSGKKRKVFGTAALLPARDKAVEIFQVIVEDGPFSQQGELAQYKLGIAHLALGNYEQAVSAFEQLIERYPHSPLADDARFQLAQASLRGTFKPEYDQRPTDHAIAELARFIETHASSDLSAEAQERLQSLRERRAEHEFQVGQFYERRRQSAAALLYYRQIVDHYPDTPWASKALSRLQVLEPTVQ